MNSVVNVTIAALKSKPQMRFFPAELVPENQWGSIQNVQNAVGKRQFHRKENEIFMKYREVGLDAQATIHMKEAMEQNKPWLCQCIACQYTMRSPAVVFAIQKALAKNTIKKELL